MFSLALLKLIGLAGPDLQLAVAVVNIDQLSFLEVAEQIGVLPRTSFRR